MGVEDPFTKRERDAINQNEPTFSRNPPGVNLPAVIDRLRASILLGNILSNRLEPAVLVGDVDDYDPVGTDGTVFDTSIGVLRVAASGGMPRAITGLKAPPPGSNHALVVINVGSSGQVNLSNNDSNSVPENRFLIAGNIMLAADEAVLIGYSVSEQRWRALSDF